MERTNRIERVLRGCFAGILAAGGGSLYVACGECGKDLPPPTDYTVKFTPCVADAGLEASVGDSGEDAAPDASDASASDASADDASDDAAGDAEVDASSDAAGDAGTEADADAGAGACFASCQEACAAMNPDPGNGGGFCLTSDAGADGVVVASCEARLTCGGRKLDGLVAPSVAARTSLGAWLARMAWLEAVSVHAFRRLARELDVHGAPKALVARARESVRDEIRHARIMARLAKKHGAVVPKVSLPRAGVRDLESIARENAVEGCVGETYGALYAAWQASHERDADVAAAMRAIAPDELRHAALGWAVAEWIDGRLDDVQRARVSRARMNAARDLVASTATVEERALAEGLMQRLWAA